jgi:hypothetical protein
MEKERDKTEKKRKEKGRERIGLEEKKIKVKG